MSRSPNRSLAPRPRASETILATSLIALASVGCAAAQATDAGAQMDEPVVSPAPTPAPMETAEPVGIYHNAFSGGFAGTEWFEVLRVPGERRYVVADIFGGGFAATVAETGTITLDGDVGGGTWQTADIFELRPRLGGSAFVFSCVRAAGTSGDFPLDPAAVPVQGNRAIAGVYGSVTEQIDPRSGATISRNSEELVVAVDGTTFRFTDPGGLFFQGVFLTPTRIGFRAIEPAPTDRRFASFPGSTINFAQNLLGTADVDGNDAWSATILLQTRTPLGQQQQTQFRFHATRKDAR